MWLSTEIRETNHIKDEVDRIMAEKQPYIYEFTERLYQFSSNNHKSYTEMVHPIEIILFGFEDGLSNEKIKNRIIKHFDVSEEAAAKLIEFANDYNKLRQCSPRPIV